MKTGLKQPCKFLVLSFLLAACAMSDSSFEQHRVFVSEQVIDNPDISSGFVSDDKFQLYYRSNGTPLKAVALWVHGTPGGWSDIGRLLVDEAFLSKIHLVSIDRPGWGRSQFKGSVRLAPEFEEQGRLIEPLLARIKQEHPDVPLILVGHSWGGSLIPYLAAEYPHYVDGLIILSSGLSPELAKPRWYNRAGKVFTRFVSEPLRAANAEIYALSPALAAMQERWTSLNIPVIVVQGEADRLVDPANADFAEAVLDPKKSHILRLPNQGHFLHMQRTDLIGRCILAMANDSLADCRENLQ